MRPMRRILAIAAACAATVLVLAAPAQGASLRELGYSTAYPFPNADCPENCQAIAQVSGFQVQLGRYDVPFRLKRPGWIVAFTVRLANPSDDQTSFFKSTYGDKPEARLATLKRTKRKHRFKLLKQTQPFNLERFFGSTPTIALHQALRVHRNEIVAITVPTWLPAFAHNQPRDMAWRSSHSGSDCTATNPGQGAQQRVGSVVFYGCFYRTARLLLTTTFVADPKQTNRP